MSHIRSGKIKAYAVTTSKRLASLPDLPTLDEAGLKGFEVTAVHGLDVNRGHAAAGDRQAHHGSTGGTYKDPKVVERFTDLGTASPHPGAKNTDRTEPNTRIRNR